MGRTHELNCASSRRLTIVCGIDGGSTHLSIDIAAYYIGPRSAAAQYADVVESSFPGAFTMFRRAAALKCPHCGSRRTFIRRWLLRYERCRTCGIRWNREQGFELGPVGLNLLFTFFSLAVGMIVAFVATSPDFPVREMTLGFMGAAIVLPLFFYPFTNTLWLAVDLLAHKPDEAELVAAAVSASPRQTAVD